MGNLVQFPKKKPRYDFDRAKEIARLFFPGDTLMTCALFKVITDEVLEMHRVCSEQFMNHYEALVDLFNKSQETEKKTEEEAE